MEVKWTVLMHTGIVLTSDNCEFSKLPALPIYTLSLDLPGSKKMIFEGFEKYVIVKTEYKIVGDNNKTVFDSLNVLAKRHDDVCQVTYHRKGGVYQMKNKWGADWREMKLIPSKVDKSYKVVPSEQAICIDRKLWHDAIWMRKAQIYLKEK